MLGRTHLLATLAILAIAPTAAEARARDLASRPPPPAWTPAAATGALARLVARGAEALPRLDELCTRRTLELPFALPFLGRTISLPRADGCGSLALDDLELPLALQLDLRELAAGVARLLPAGEVPDLRALTSSPVPGVESSGFGWRRDPIHHRAKFHKGTDFRARRGTPVYAAGPGRVVFTGSQRGYGNIIYVDHGGGVVTRYAHLHRFEIERGELVAGGSLIGRVGATGRATGPHLHFEVRLGDRAVEPALAMRIGELQRTDPDAARVAAAGLAAEAQYQKVDRHDPPSRRKADRRRGQGRPERRGAPKRVRAVS